MYHNHAKRRLAHQNSKSPGTTHRKSKSPGHPRSPEQPRSSKQSGSPEQPQNPRQPRSPGANHLNHSQQNPQSQNNGSEFFLTQNHDDSTDVTELNHHSYDPPHTPTASQSQIATSVSDKPATSLQGQREQSKPLFDLGLGTRASHQEEDGGGGGDKHTIRPAEQEGSEPLFNLKQPQAKRGRQSEKTHNEQPHDETLMLRSKPKKLERIYRSYKDPKDETEEYKPTWLASSSKPSSNKTRPPRVTLAHAIML